MFLQLSGGMSSNTIRQERVVDGNGHGALKLPVSLQVMHIWDQTIRAKNTIKHTTIRHVLHSLVDNQSTTMLSSVVARQPASSFNLQSPSGVAFDPYGNLFIVEQGEPYNAMVAKPKCNHVLPGNVGA
jgi:hypothetical protein